MSKGRIIRLLHILQQETDYSHPLNSEQLITLLQQQGESVERKTIYDDVRTLNSCGYNIEQVHEGELNGYYYDSPLFDSAELRILVDAVNAGNFITGEKSDQMVKRLLSLTNRFDRNVIEKTAGYRRHKTANRSIIYNIDTLQRAIFGKNPISFDYFFYDIRNEKNYRRRSRYHLIPYALIWNQERYYLIGYDERHADFAHYRVDRMEKVDIEPEKAEMKPFDLQQYMEKTFEMFSGEDIRVTLRCRSHLAGEINDQFGDSKITVSSNDDFFEVNVGVRNNLMFYGWIFKFGDDIEILSPDSIRKEYRALCMSAAARYE